MFFLTLIVLLRIPNLKLRIVYKDKKSYINFDVFFCKELKVP